jgi:Flp pilus assembly pilin Flp
MQGRYASPERPPARWKVLFTREEGASLAEYGLLVGLIAAVCIGAVTLFGVNVVALFQQVQAPL